MISLIVPIYNSSKYLNSCIDSILNQSYEDFELFLIDDGSSDNSLEICKSYNDRRIHIVALSHKGVSFARNMGINKSNGEYICFVDSDDVLDANYLSEMYKYMYKDISYVECNFDYFSDTVGKIICSNEYKKFTRKEMFYRMYSNEGIRTNIIVNKLYRKSLFKDICFEDVCHEDEYIIHKIINKTLNVVVLNDVLYHYRIHSNSRQRSISPRRIDVINVYHERSKIFNDEKFQDLNYKAMLNEIIYLYCVFSKYRQIDELDKLYNLFRENYNSKYKFDKKRKIKYKLFIKFPNLLARSMLLNRRYKYV